MNDVNLLAVVVSAVVVLVVSTVWYTAFGRQLAELSPAYVHAGGQREAARMESGGRARPKPRPCLGGGRLAEFLDVVDWTGAVRLGLAL